MALISYTTTRQRQDENFERLLDISDREIRSVLLPRRVHITFSKLLALASLNVLIPRVSLLNRVRKVVDYFVLEPRISIGESVSFARKTHARNLRN